MSWSEFTALLLLATAVSFTPGPNTTLSAAMGAQGGMRHALPFVCAVPVGWGLLLTLSTLGVGAIIMQTTHAKLVIAVLGAGYLVWLAKRLLGVKPAPATSQALPQDTVRVGFLAGIGLQFVNIKAWMLALSIVAGWLTGQQQLLARFATVLPVMMAYAFFSNLLYAWIGAALRIWLQKGQRLRWFNGFMACNLLLTAAWILMPFLVS